MTGEPATRLVLFLASGKADALSGRFFAVPEDPAKVVERAEEVKREDLYTLRIWTMPRLCSGLLAAFSGGPVASVHLTCSGLRSINQ